jgi:hypothetical protein
MVAWTSRRMLGSSSAMITVFIAFTAPDGVL